VVTAVAESGLPTSGSAPETAVPGTASTTELFSGLWRGRDAADADATAVAGAMVLGWLIFGEFMVETTGADAQAVRRRVAEQVSALFGPTRACCIS
jgi:TetR/AcrR family transcriptional regulator, repressor for neighboring sulfatase